MIFWRGLTGAYVLIVLSTAVGTAAEPVSQNEAKARTNGIHARPWAFGSSQSRHDAIWKKGVAGDIILKKTRQEKLGKGEDSEQAQAERKNSRSVLGMSMEEQAGMWKVAPEKKTQQPDENIYRDRRRVVRAFADVRAGDNFDISVGPELILKDEQHGEENANDSQPDSELGLGLKFKYGF